RVATQAISCARRILVERLQQIPSLPELPDKWQKRHKLPSISVAFVQDWANFPCKIFIGVGIKKCNKKCGSGVGEPHFVIQ
ncbi:MAG: hypothetical protein PUD91_05860, partial [Bacteroidales bacterium]|nr:hypothetical protein [Bacteroidales bacterium]